MEKQMIAAGTPNFIGVKSEYSDEQIREHVETVYGWTNVTITRQPHIVKVQPKKNGRNSHE